MVGGGYYGRKTTRSQAGGPREGVGGSQAQPEEKQLPPAARRRLSTSHPKPLGGKCLRSTSERGLRGSG